MSVMQFMKLCFLIVLAMGLPNSSFAQRSKFKKGIRLVKFEQHDVWVDTTQMNESLYGRILSALGAFSNYKVDIDATENEGVERAYRALFNGSTLKSSLPYLSDRVHFIMGSSDQTFGESKARVVASNPSLLLVLEYYIERLFGNEWEADETKDLFDRMGLDIESTRLGLILAKPSLSRDPLLAAASLIHEARHSDCTGGLKLNGYGIYQFFKGDTSYLGECTHVHAPCPEGHDLEGLPACDRESWGAYGVNAVFDGVVSAHCKGCTESRKDTMEAAYLDAKSRVSQSAFEAMTVTDKWVSPDLSSPGIHLPSPSRSFKSGRRTELYKTLKNNFKSYLNEREQQ